VKLLVDLGNTRLKWATLAGQRMSAGGVFAHAGKPLLHDVRTEWSELAHVGGVLVASVVAPAREDELDAFVRERFGVHAQFVRSPAAALGVRNAYAEPARLGVDRFLALAALHAQRSRVQVMVSVGTALTLDALDADGIHHGGLIVASPHLMRETLLMHTARIGTVDGRCTEMPRSTADAVMTGSLYAAAGAIERFCASTARLLGAPPGLILTGGGADELAPLLGPFERAHDLVLHGLAMWAEASMRAS
jgi:type III pantothenate kinase